MIMLKLASKDYIKRVLRIYSNDYIHRNINISTFKKDLLSKAFIETGNDLENVTLSNPNATIFVDSSAATSITDLVEKFSEEFRNYDSYKFDYAEIKYSVRYPFTDKNSNILMKYFIEYQHRNGYYPTYVIKKSRNKDMTHMYYYFYIYLPLYNFIEHRKIITNSTEYKYIIKDGKSKILKILGDEYSKVRLDYNILKEIDSIHNKSLGKGGPEYISSTREAFQKEIDEKGYIDADNWY